MPFNLKRSDNNNSSEGKQFDKPQTSETNYDDVNSMLSELDDHDDVNFDNNEPPAYFNEANQPPLDYQDIPPSYTQPDNTIGTEEENLVKYENGPSSTASMSYEGEKITDLQGTGINTNILTEDTKPSQNPVKTTNYVKFNRALLESLSLRSVLKAFGSEEIKPNLYRWKEYDISIKDNKWYNTHTDITRGNINAMSLTKHLFALEHQLSEKDNQDRLYVLAGNFLTELSQKNIDEEVEQIAKIPDPIAQNETNTPAAPQRTKEENNALFKELVEQLNDIDLEIVMEDIGANPNEDGHRGKWKVWSTGDNIALTGQRWYSWKAQQGGVGALSLLQFHLATIHNLDLRIEEQKKQAWKMAFNELKSKFSESDLKDLAGSGGKLEAKLNFHMPHEIPFKLNDVRHYLNVKRGLPLWIINKQIKAKSLFAGFPSDWRENKNLQSPEKLDNSEVWATFLSVNKTAAEMRGIDRYDGTAKLLAKGSDKELGGFLIKGERDLNQNTKTVSTLEASIDAMSYHAFYPNRTVMSCMGVNFKLAVRAAVDALDREYNFQFAFDNDQAGNEAALRFREELMIALEEGEEEGTNEYMRHVQANRIHYFDLGIRCLAESIRTNKIFYLDVQDNHIGLDVVKLFQEQASKTLGKDTVRQAITNGQLKYLNVSPNFEMIRDIQKEAQMIFDKLNSGKPYYLRIKDEEDIEMTSVQKEQLKEKIQLFTKTFKEIAGDKFLQWEKEGLIIHSKIAIAKDWNEYFIYMKENNLEFKKSLIEQEKTYQHYSIKEEEVPSPKKKSKRI